MFLVNGFKATLRQFNRNDSKVFDDEDYTDVSVKICPYDVEQAIRFGIYTVPEATGYYQVHRWVDVREGDQIIFKGQTHTVLRIEEGWIFNRVENKILVVK
jgi:hypothetical protein